jgi:DNA (cytosine-5)-methyltransferase 1
MSTTLTFGSLFAGIGGFDLGLERSGMQCKWQVEIDPYCQRVLRKHWPDVQRYSDIRLCGRHNLETVDVVCGGFPCQDISNAGKRAGIDGERSGLWSEFFRIICELRPRYVIVENVAALLIRGIDRVLGDLASVGYDAEWRVLSARQFGASHRRERVFILAYPQRQGLPRYQPYSRMLGSAPTPHAEFGNSPLGSRGNLETAIRSIPHVNGVSLAVVRRRTKPYGNAVVPQIAEWIGKRIIESDNAALIGER